MALLPITTEDFDLEVLDGITVVDFFTDYCPCCPAMVDILERLSDEMPEVKFLTCNAEEEPTLTIRYKIQSYPSLVLLKNGRHLATYDKGQNYQAVLAWFNDSQM